MTLEPTIRASKFAQESQSVHEQKFAQIGLLHRSGTSLLLIVGDTASGWTTRQL
ncbi:MAG: hypothetical protein ACYCDN_00065 [Schaalia turicensis]